MEPPVSAPGALPYPPLQAVGEGAAAVRRAADAPRCCLPHGVVCVAGADDRVCDLVQERVSDVVPGLSQHVADRECDGPRGVPADAGAGRGGLEAEAPPCRRRARVEVAFQELRSVVLDLLHRRSARGAGFDELESGVLHAPSAGLAAGDDGFVAPQLGDGAEDGAPVAVEERDDAPHGELLPREVSVDQSFGHRGRKRAVRRPLMWLHPRGGAACSGRTGGQCTAAAVGQYSTSRWHISASSSRSW